MLVTIDQALDSEQVITLRKLMLGAPDAWVDGRTTAGYQGAPVKFNLQIDERSDVAARGRAIILAALERHPLFISAALPNQVYPPMFNRYGEGMTFGAHIDGGELEIVDTYGTHSVKLKAGDLVLYPSTSLHQVTPVTRGERLASFFWIQSLVRDDGRRALLYDLDLAIQRLNQTGADEEARRTLVGCYHNLLRQWAET